MNGSPDAVADADRWLTGAAIDQSAVLFVIGLGEGRLLTALERRGWRGRVVALEPVGTSSLAPSAALSVLTGPDYTGLDQVVMALEPDRDQPVVVGDPAVMRAHRDEAVRVTRLVVRAWFGARANQEARRKYAGPYLLNTLRNLPAIAASEDAGSLVHAFPGLPAVLVAAGPSLDANLPEIVMHRDKVVLIAVDTAVRPLLAAGVQPDFVVALDPSDVNASHLVDLPACPGTWLVAEGSLDPVVFDHFAGRACVFRVADHHPWPWLRRLGLDRQLLRAWGSVLTTAFDLALQMGCDPIVFTGADLAFTNGRPYARGTTFEEEWRRALAWGDSLEMSWAQRVAAWPEMLEAGVDGTPVRTAPHLCAFRDWIVAEAARVPGRAVVNATGAGILTGPAVRQATLTEALGGRAPLAVSASDLMRRRQASGRRPDHGAIPAVPDEVRRDWQTFSGVTAEAIDDALAPMPAAALAPASAPAVVPEPAAAHSEAAADERFLQELAVTMSVRRHRVTSPEQDVLGELRALTLGLSATDAVVVVDEVGVSAGAQVRQAVDVLLCERPDLWLEYRRFVDHASRLTILRGEASRRTPPADEADLAKWDAEHAPVAAELVPLLVRQLGPRSVIDLGCGAGYWLRAFEEAGVTDVLGVSARTTPLGAVPGPGRRFDLCLCLEVAQQLSPADQQALIGACTRASDVVVFSSRLPGAPGSSPHDRPLQHWAEAFWRHGYVLDDTLRQVLERRADIPRSVFEVMVMFRRARTAPSTAPGDGAEASLRALALASAARLNDLYTQKIWWAVAALDRAAAIVPEWPHEDRVPWVIPPSRLLTAPDGARVFRFRTNAARWYLTHPAGSLQVCEDQRPLLEKAAAALVRVEGGGWARWRDEIHVRSSDGSDPRTNRRRYSLWLPSHVAWAEGQPLREVLGFGL